MKKLLGAVFVFFVAVTVQGADVDDLAKKLKDKDADNRRAAALALGKIGNAGLPALTAVLKNHDADPQVRRNAILGVTKQGTSGRAAIPALLEILTEKDSKGKKAPPSPDSLKIDVVAALGEI